MLELFFAEFRRRWILFRRYPIEAIAGIIVFASIFYGLFLSASYIAGPNFQLGERLDSMIVGYVLWTLTTSIFFDIGGQLQQEALTGTLEQVFLARYSAIQVFLMRSLANLSFQIIQMFGILCIIIILIQSHLNFPPTLVFAFITVLLGAYGIAFILGSLSLLFKRVQQVIPLLQFPFLFLLTTPTETWTGKGKLFAQILPMTPGAGLLRDLMARGESLNLTSLAIALLNGSIYFAVGLLLFRIAEYQTKRRGMLSGY